MARQVYAGKDDLPNPTFEGPFTAMKKRRDKERLATNKILTQILMAKAKAEAGAEAKAKYQPNYGFEDPSQIPQEASGIPLYGASMDRRTGKYTPTYRRRTKNTWMDKFSEESGEHPGQAIQASRGIPALPAMPSIQMPTPGVRPQFVTPKIGGSIDQNFKKRAMAAKGLGAVEYDEDTDSFFDEEGNEVDV